ncbi:sensor histidine kinase [Spirosoma montaniterrae]|uniref:Signal transduction histidine kinase internal region domain-containing protein n=1 Tax=Spirosoma montaniterrae TaxID=1178516 RepID=A0A1P9X0F2_9BACT|nr:histidine kinase [Spirosoma montaniterrae]AQG81092.1 hypothetical protein AWR27_18255 [Spirosoma montaniterrae]
MQLLTNEFVFSDKPRHWLARHGLFWVVWLVYFMITYSFLPAAFLLRQGVSWPIAYAKGFTLALIDAVLFMPAHMLFTYSILYWLLPRFVIKGRYEWGFICLVAILLCTAVTSAILSIYVVDPIRAFFGAPMSRSTFVGAIMAGMRGGTTIGGFAAAIRLAKVWYLKQQAYQQIEREKLQAELQLLKSQVHPHFLFNTLNNLYALTLRKADNSPTVVLKLSELLSYMLYDCNATEVLLEKEIQFMRNYIGLEQLRYGDRLDMSVQITGNYHDKLIAPLLLVPFLENAFKHGTSEQLEQSWMHLDLSVQDTTLKFKLINSRETAEHDESYVGGIGLRNVQKRLRLLYPDRHDLRLTAEPETFMVMLTLDLSSAPKPTASPVFAVEEVH